MCTRTPIPFTNTPDDPDEAAAAAKVEAQRETLRARIVKLDPSLNDSPNGAVIVESIVADLFKTNGKFAVMTQVATLKQAITHRKTILSESTDPDDYPTELARAS